MLHSLTHMYTTPHNTHHMHTPHTHTHTTHTRTPLTLAPHSHTHTHHTCTHITHTHTHTPHLHSKLDETERDLFRAGQQAVGELEQWERGQSHRITMATTLQGSRKRKRENGDD